jgi:hypothetical protein
MNFINGFGSNTKQADKIRAELRISKLTIFKIDIDLSRKNFELIFFNFGIKNS